MTSPLILKQTIKPGLGNSIQSGSKATIQVAGGSKLPGAYYVCLLKLRTTKDNFSHLEVLAIAVDTIIEYIKLIDILGGIIPERYQLHQGKLKRSAMLNTTQELHQGNTQESLLEDNTPNQDPESYPVRHMSRAEEHEGISTKVNPCLYYSCKDEDQGTIE